MFSSRLGHEFIPNRLSRLLAEKKAQGHKIFDLTQSNPTQAGFSYEEEKIIKAIAHSQSMIYEPSPNGLKSARVSIADYYRQKGMAIDPEFIFLTAGTSEAYSFLFKLLADPGDEILIPQPGYPLFEFLTALESIRSVPYNLKYDSKNGWKIDLDLLEICITDKTRAIVVINPNNPTGNFLKIDEFNKINKLCSERNIAIISDEVFSDYGYKSDMERVDSVITNQDALSFVLNGLSKISGLPQLKLGWIYIGGPEPFRSQAAERMEFITDTYLSVSTPIQWACRHLLESRTGIQHQIRERIEINRSVIHKLCSETANIRLLECEGGWYAILEIEDDVPDDERTCELLEKKSIFVHPGYFYGFSQDGFIVISLLAQTEILSNGIKGIVSNYGKFSA